MYKQIINFKNIRYMFGVIFALLIAILICNQNLANAENPNLMKDRSKIVISGLVVEAKRHGFTLDYGQGVILVEMDDWDWYDESAEILPGQQVTVEGRIDADLFETRSIEAETVYVRSKNTLYYASDIDEEYDYNYIPSNYLSTLKNGAEVTVTGVVGKIEGREFDLSTGNAVIHIDSKLMSYNPLDNVGFQALKKGDRITVRGTLDDSFFAGREINAKLIVKHERDKKKTLNPVR